MAVDIEFLKSLYSKNAEQEMEEFYAWKAKIDEKFEKMTPEDFDSWDPEDDYIPELDDIKPYDEKVDTNNIFYDEEDIEWKDEYNLIDDADNKLELASNIDIYSGDDFDETGKVIK